MGVVYTMTIPPLMQKSNEQNAVVRLKKTYSMLSSAYTLAVSDNGTPDSWGLSSATAYDSAVALKMMNTIKPYIKIEKDCGNDSAITGCFPNTVYSYKNGASWTSWVNINTGGSQFARVRLADGSSLAAQYTGVNTNCAVSNGPTPALQSTCGIFYVDVDGQNGPSQLGTDLFGFYLTPFGIVPTGTAPETGAGFSNNCIAGGRWGCTAWVIYNENMDYLKPCGSTLSWTGAHSCN